MTAPARLAELLLEKLRIKGKPDLSFVCREIGLRVREVESVGFDGTLVRSRSTRKGVIGVRISIAEEGRKRFTIAHEIGHFVIPQHQFLKNVCRESVIASYRSTLNKAEIEANHFAATGAGDEGEISPRAVANHFAAELLLPAPAMRERFRREPSVADISQIAQEFETSLSATALRFVDLTDAAVALLWLQEGRSWVRRSDSFRYFLPLEELPSAGSMAGKLLAGASSANDFEAVEAGLWLGRRDAERVGSLLEHSISLPNYGAVLTMLWAPEERLSADEEDPYLEELSPDDFTLRRKRWPR